MPDRPLEGDPQDLAEQEQAALLQAAPEMAAMQSQAPAQDPTQVSAQNAEGNTPDPNALTQEEEDALVALIDSYDDKEDDFRFRMLPEWKLLELYWEGQQTNIWSQVAQDWRDVGEVASEAELDLEGFEPRTVNIYRAHGESIIAALSSGVPSTKFFPDDADSVDDVTTAKVYSRAAELIQRRNKAPLLLIKALWILWNHGVVGAYNFVREDDKLGTIVKPIIGTIPREVPTAHCPQCGYDAQPAPEIQCEACGYQGPPEVDSSIVPTPGVVGQQEIPRITEDIYLYSPLYFRVPHWVTDQKSSPYVGLDTENSLGSIIAAFKLDVPDIRDKVKGTKDDTETDRWARQNHQDMSTDLVTTKERWIRGWALEEIEDEAARESLLKKFPDGVYCLIADGNYITSRGENLDDHWTISVSPVSSHLYARALGESVKDIQDMTNELVTMVLDNIEHGTPMSFIDKDMLNLKNFKDSKTVPGAMYPVKVPPGQNIGNFIYETRSATLSEEVREFQVGLKEYGQFSSGAYPSIYGGQIQGGSNTAREYVESRQTALQRLQITWRIVNEWWTEMIRKATTDYLKNLSYDEKMVKPSGKNSFINVWIRKSEMTGKIGEVVAESSEKFPITWVQKKDTLMEMLQLKDPNILTAMFHPENTGVVSELLGFPEFYIPGDDARSKQLNEIVELLMGQPMMVMGPMGPVMKSSVPIQQETDDHNIESETIKAFINSEVGQQIKKENPAGYMNLLAHFSEHQQVLQMLQQQQMMMEMAMKNAGNQQGSGEGGGGEPNVEAPPQEAASA